MTLYYILSERERKRERESETVCVCSMKSSMGEWIFLYGINSFVIWSKLTSGFNVQPKERVSVCVCVREICTKMFESKSNKEPASAFLKSDYIKSRRAKINLIREKEFFNFAQIHFWGKKAVKQIFFFCFWCLLLRPYHYYYQYRTQGNTRWLYHPHFVLFFNSTISLIYNIIIFSKIKVKKSKMKLKK